MKAAIIGCGRIGCGFAGELLADAGYELVFLARNASMVEHLNRLGRYHVTLAQGRERTKRTVTGVRAIDTSHRAAAVAALAEADLIVTAVGAPNLGDIAPLIAQALQARSRPVNVLAFENLADGGVALQQEVAAHLPHDFPLEKFGFSGTLVSRAVTQRLGDPALDEPLEFVGDPPATFVVDGKRLVSPVPALPSMTVAEDFGAWMVRKLYIFSAGHAACAYLGHLKGYRYIHSAIRDPEIRTAVLDAMREGQRGLAGVYGEAFAGGEAHLQEIVERFDNAAIMDSISRVARDPSRKLSAGDRLLGAARLAAKAGVHPRALLRAAAAAYCFTDPDDARATELQEQIRVAGMRPTLRRVSGLEASDRLGRALVNRWHRLAHHWHSESVLLSLNKVVWA
ncbi:MAG TPA: 2-dehydropantoate 2-reductase N-terminal domain-containing protein [Usitatibacter sp.]|nr:2-dehydropantoate 2-reductase N-terminal domain-containing protein [Usitatibacter sp.]